MMRSERSIVSAAAMGATVPAYALLHSAALAWSLRASVAPAVRRQNAKRHAKEPAIANGSEASSRIE